MVLIAILFLGSATFLKVSLAALALLATVLNITAKTKNPVGRLTFWGALQTVIQLGVFLFGVKVLGLETSANNKSAADLKDTLASIKGEVEGVLTKTNQNLDSSKRNLQTTQTSLEQIGKVSKSVQRTYSIETGGKSFILLLPRVVSESSIRFDVTMIGNDPLRDLVVSLGGLSYTGTPYGLSMMPQWQYHYDMLSQYRKFESELTTPNYEVPLHGLMVYVVSQGLNGRTDQIIRWNTFAPH
ncbi:MAG: DUF948 domain-containing protein [Acidobacteriota bacterium]|nr:DUF948 domain-containing protein [Acidobacteriota bacterium]